jgi:hypothetical protein
MNRRWRWPVLTLIGPVAALAAIWAPLLAHYLVLVEPVAPETVATASRPLSSEARALLDWRGFEVPVRAGEGRARERADRLIGSGRLRLGSFPEQRVRLPFHPGDLENGGVSWRLQMAAMAVPRLFLDAYRESGDRRFLRRARQTVLAWADFQADQWLPVGLLWNDHAVAARLFVLADFWQAAREYPDLLSEDQAAAVLELVIRDIRMTARPAHYNPRTNHGIIQDLALWHAALAFPGLEAGRRAAQVAYERFAGHLPYYLSREGAVLEHSAGYHRVGLSLVGRAFRYMTLHGQAVREGWLERYQAGIRFYRLLKRPDGTLPRIGDTHPEDASDSLAVAQPAGSGGVRLVPEGHGSRPAASAFLPVAGYAVQWRGESAGGTQGVSQTAVVWSRFPRHGHKHADEPSLHYWADGVDWWTAVGYWPYGHPQRKEAAGWTGANAPHFAGEPADSARRVTLLGRVGGDGALGLLDLQRETADGYRVRRQILSLPSGTRTVIDSAEDAVGRPTEAVWRTGPRVIATAEGKGAYRLREPATGATLGVWSSGWDATLVRGPRAEGVRGMVVAGRRPVATTALLLRRPSNGLPGLLAWRPEGGAGGLDILDWSGPEAWRLRMPGGNGAWRVERRGNRIRAEAPGGQVVTSRVAPAPEVAGERQRIRRAFTAMAAEYGGFRSLVPYRVKTSWLAAALFVGHVGGLLVLPGWLGQRRAALLILGGWLAYILWLRLYYFPA